MNQLLLRFKDLITPTRVIDPPVGRFIKGINFGGDVVMIEGSLWDSYRSALQNGLSVPGAQAITTEVIPRPRADQDIRTMLNTVICKSHTLEITQTLPNGAYNLYLWIMENYQSDWHALEVCIKGQSIAKDVGKLPLAGWSRYGAYSVIVQDEVLQLSISTNDPHIDAHVMGMSIFQV